MKRWVETAKFAAALVIILGGCSVFYGAALFAEGYRDGRFMPNEEEQLNGTSILVIFVTVFVLLGAVSWWLPWVLKILYP